MKIRLTQPGFENYAGQLGVLMFENGLSTTDATSINIARLSAVMLCEWETGGNPSVTASILSNSDTAAPMFSSAQDGSDHDKAAKELCDAQSTVKTLEAESEPLKTVEDSDVKPKFKFEMAQLEAIADKDGIKGLRVIGDPLGIKSNSIKELIEAIMKAG